MARGEGTPARQTKRKETTMKRKRIWALLLALGMLALAVCGCQKEQSVEEWEAKELDRVKHYM